MDNYSVSEFPQHKYYPYNCSLFKVIKKYIGQGKG